MGEARQRRAAGLDFKSESREVQKIKKATEKKLADEIAFEKALRDHDDDQIEWEGLDDETGEVALFRWNEEKQENEIWNRETQEWEED